jgi:hypothetical protein
MGDNHFVVHGPLPDRDAARGIDSTLVHHSDWSDNTAFARELAYQHEGVREDLEWAVIVPGDSEISPAVARLLDELAARGITIHNSSVDYR